MAENLKWPKKHWTLHLRSIVIENALAIYIQLTIEQSSNYETIIELILNAIGLVS